MKEAISIYTFKWVCRGTKSNGGYIDDSLTMKLTGDVPTEELLKSFRNFLKGVGLGFDGEIETKESEDEN